MGVDAGDEKCIMSDERTPLITVVQTRPHRDRYPHHRLRYVCTLFLSISLFTGLIAAVLILNFLPLGDDDSDTTAGLSTSRYLPGKLPDGWPNNRGLDYDSLVAILKETPDSEKAREWSRYYTSGPHLAGKNLSQAIWTKERWEEFGVASTIVDYDVYINYPKGHRLALLEKEKGEKDAAEDQWKIKYEASLEEDVLKEDATSGLKDRVPTFHGYSASGNVTAGYVFVNYGTYQDFEDLQAANVPLEGKIALVKYGGVFRGLKVKRAQELGMVGAIIYTDPGDDGEVTEENGYDTYPNGPARQPSSVQRGSCQFLSFAPGDPTTPGYPSKPGAPRQDTSHAIPSIPSIPISYQDALPLLKALNGHGPKASSFSKSWHGGGLGYKGVDYNIGPSPDSLSLNLINEQDYVTTPLWNVIGIINGTIPDEIVVLGNHRDAWIAGGAGDPNSGSAAFNELIRGFGIATRAGWRPLRTIVFASWDGEEYGLVGSTEWVEEYLPWLSASTVAYLNVDVGTRGPDFKLTAAPLLEQVVIDALELVQSPNQTVPGQTVGDTWDKKIATMGSGSDYTAFQDFAGIPSIDMGFRASGNSPVYHYHSNYDSFTWMERYGDPDFLYHETIAKIWALVAAKLVETPVLQLSATRYAEGLRRYVESVKTKLDSESSFDLGDGNNEIFDALDTAVDRFHFAATLHDGTAAALLQQLYDNDIPWWKFWEKIQLYYAIRRINTKYKLLERKFLYAEGLDGRPWFKHVVFAPGKWTGYAGATFPGIVEAIEEKDAVAALKWIGIATGVVEGAVEWLEED
ncbi:N-acetylated-alpha-linked acidic dipeptidase-like protein [Bimuria novae-zelandiae CBS 107.79]|uniref:N-acetylated-alpha-linked acidic dipeptidase-like protein n=1 Tax=Bimuria novae-zelandiae CBS 107.79 TaxID=1447943 RepID=A0A6A5VP18_9PLEO|nr:N-acetylated-alpha-linked acidic dipeptidase-like protein [Bimuria novae-zelandiae CBS 107.79]